MPLALVDHDEFAKSSLLSCRFLAISILTLLACVNFANSFPSGSSKRTGGGSTQSYLTIGLFIIKLKPSTLVRSVLWSFRYTHKNVCWRTLLFVYKRKTIYFCTGPAKIISKYAHPAMGVDHIHPLLLYCSSCSLIIPTAIIVDAWAESKIDCLIFLATIIVYITTSIFTFTPGVLADRNSFRAWIPSHSVQHPFNIRASCGRPCFFRSAQQLTKG